MPKKGSLVVVGSGIKAVSHFTLEAQAHIQNADIVLYAAADPVTDMWIERQNPNAFDLYQYYANDKARIITYAQMIERVLDEVRAGKYVCALFYGHPGVFVTPSHNAIALAQSEGYDAVMLPAISAEDCLYADLGIDPSTPGLQMLEATDLLMRSRVIDTSCNVILFQVGCIGDMGFRFDGYKNDKFDVLLDYLEKFYGEDHIATNYVANMFAGPPQIDHHTIAEYRDPKIAAKVTGISSFFIAAVEEQTNDDEMLAKLGLRPSGPGRTTPLICDRDDYSVLAELARRNNHNHRVPEGYKFSYASDALYDTLVTLALDWEAQQAYTENPREYLAGIQGLTREERMQLQLQHHGVTRMLFKVAPEFDATRFIGDALQQPDLAGAYRNVQKESYDAVSKGEITRAEYEDRLDHWFQSKGYATTASAVTAGMKGVRTS